MHFVQISLFLTTISNQHIVYIVRYIIDSNECAQLFLYFRPSTHFMVCICVVISISVFLGVRILHNNKSCILHLEFFSCVSYPSYYYCRPTLAKQCVSLLFLFPNYPVGYARFRVHFFSSIMIISCDCKVYSDTIIRTVVSILNLITSL